MLLASAHQTPHRDDRRVHDTQLPVARQEGEPPQQKRHGTGHLKRWATDDEDKKAVISFTVGRQPSGRDHLGHESVHFFLFSVKARRPRYQKESKTKQERDSIYSSSHT